MDFQFFERLDDLPDDVNSLWERAASESFFLSRWWFETILGAGLDSGDRPAFGVLRGDEGRPWAIIPGRFVRRPLGPMSASELQSLTGMYACHFRPVMLTDGDRDAAAEALGTMLGRALHRGNVIHFDALDAQWPALGAFERGLGKSGRRVARYDHFGNWSEKIGKRSFEAYMRDRDGALREIIRRKGGTLEQQGRISYEIIHRPDRSSDGIAVYEAVYAKSWKEAEPYPAFQPLLMRNACREGALRLGICRVDQTPVAVQLWILWHGSATVLKLAHDRDVDELSVGTLLTAHMIEHLIRDEGAVKLDFGRGDDPYKARWATDRQQRIGLIAANPASVIGLATLARQYAGRWRHMGRRATPSGQDP
jgi:Acetyltransferase (GNAT) domain